VGYDAIGTFLEKFLFDNLFFKNQGKINIKIRTFETSSGLGVLLALPNEKKDGHTGPSLA
jgi:hypothetical protein